MKNRIKEEVEFITKTLVMVLAIFGAWVILGAMILCWNLPGFIDGIIVSIMLIGVPVLVTNALI